MGRSTLRSTLLPAESSLTPVTYLYKLPEIHSVALQGSPFALPLKGQRNSNYLGYMRLFNANVSASYRVVAALQWLADAPIMRVAGAGLTDRDQSGGGGASWSDTQSGDAKRGQSGHPARADCFTGPALFDADWGRPDRAACPSLREG